MSESLDEILTSESKGDSRPRDEAGRWVKSPAPEVTKPQESAPVVAAEAAPEPAPAPQAPEPQQQAQAPSAEPAPPPSAAKDPVQGLQAGIAAEREKRQAAERAAEEVRAELAQMREQFQQFMQQQQRPAAHPPAPEPPPVDIWTDPDKYIDHKASALLQPVRQQYDTEIWNLREELARTRYPDYDEARNAFLKAANDNPTLRDQFSRAPNPIDFAYTKGKELFAAEEAKWMERLRPKLQPPAPTAPAANPVPSSLNAEPSPSTPAFTFTPTPLGSVLPNKF